MIAAACASHGHSDSTETAFRHQAASAGLSRTRGRRAGPRHWQPPRPGPAPEHSEAQARAAAQGRQAGPAAWLAAYYCCRPGAGSWRSRPDGSVAAAAAAGRRPYSVGQTRGCAGIRQARGGPRGRSRPLKSAPVTVTVGCPGRLVDWLPRRDPDATGCGRGRRHHRTSSGLATSESVPAPEPAPA